MTLDLIRAEAERSWPRESCGLLIGRGGETARVRKAIPAENRAARDDRYLIDAHEVMRAVLVARRAGLELLGAYHSHPGADMRPSATDAEESWGDWLYLIVACERGKPGDVGCWRWTGDDFAFVHVEADDDHESPTPSLCT